MATTALIESFIDYSIKKTVYSPQYIVDCADKNDKCEGGDGIDSLEYIQKHGLPYENDYPYINKNGTCDRSIKTNIPFTKFKNGTLEPLDYEQLNTWYDIVEEYPLYSEIDTRSDVFSLYIGGIMDPKHMNCTEENHSVNLVGIKFARHRNILIVRNSHGKSWGENGYFKIYENFLHNQTCFLQQHFAFITK